MISLQVRPLVVIGATGGLLLLLLLAYLAYVWWKAQPLIETHIDGILACYPEESEQYRDDNLVLMPDGRSRQPRPVFELAQHLLQSADTDERAIGIAVFFPRGGRLGQFQRLAAANPENKLAALHVLKACLSDVSAPGCNKQVDVRVAELDPENIFAWGLIAQYRHARGDDFSAKLAMRQAALAPAYDDYFLYQLRRTYEAINEIGVGQSVLPNFNIVNYVLTANLVSSHYGSYCSAVAQGQPEVGGYCVALFEAMADHSTTILHEQLGLAWQEVMYQLLGEEAEAERVARLMEETRSAIFDLPGGHEANILRAYDSELSDQWMQDWIQFGERHAYEALVTGARRKSADPDYRPCRPAGLRFEFPRFYVGDEPVTL